MGGQDIDHHACPEPRERPAAWTTASLRIADPEMLRRAYDRCRRTAAVHGRTYYLATRLLSAEQRPAVHALYAFARMVDDIVDGPALRDAPSAVLDSVELALRTSWSPAAPLVPPQPSVTVPAESPGLSATPPFDSLRSTATAPLDSLWSSTTTPLHPSRPDATAPAEPGLSIAPPFDYPRSVPTRLLAAPPSATTPLDPPGLGALPAGFDEIALALTDTVTRFAIDPGHFRTFLDSMRMDAPGSPLFRNRYPTMAALDEYMRGSAAAIGLQLLPVLGTVVPRAAAEPAAAALGNAFQLTNFLRDIGEDLDRDRIYLPADELAAFGVDEELLVYCHRTRSTDRRVRRALAHLIAVNRDLYRRAHPGIELLSPRVRPGIRAAATVYAAILERIEDSGYNVFARRAVVPGARRLQLAAAAALRR
ncbi:squalene/phytoene synthase family protein [Nocardia sp. NPDC058499]|uniref:phytoene/squalene synthase family protein n=1 Tax=Nocardia sp. NPDC058499 TaxID=3346530 RepID=UPI00364D3481